jgi:hypothetical protein
MEERKNLTAALPLGDSTSTSTRSTDGKGGTAI